MRALEAELGRIYFLKPGRKLKKWHTVFYLGLAAAFIYLGIGFFFLHELWYHFFLVVFSGGCFWHILKEWFFEWERKNLLRETNEFLCAFARCYEGNRGNLKSAIEGAADRGTERMGRFAFKIEEALGQADFEEACENLKKEIPLQSLQCFVDLLAVLKMAGRLENGAGEDHFQKAFQQLSTTVSHNMIQEEQNDADSKTMELWVLLSPIVIVPGTQLVYLLLFQRYFDVLSGYETLEAKTAAALAYLLSSIGALFLNWIRKNR